MIPGFALDGAGVGQAAAAALEAVEKASDGGGSSGTAASVKSCFFVAETSTYPLDQKVGGDVGFLGVDNGGGCGCVEGVFDASEEDAAVVSLLGSILEGLKGTRFPSKIELGRSRF